MLAAIILQGCAAHWQRITLPPDTVLASRQQVQLWQGTRARVLHAVRVTPDSLLGIPFQKPPSCDSCRVTLARAQIDSVRFGDQETVGLVTVAYPFAALILFLYVSLRGLGGS